MRPSIRRVARWIGLSAAIVLLVVVGAVLYALHAYDRVWDIALPSTRASDDPAVIARGEYLVFGPAHCSDCHAADTARAAMFRGEIVPLTGGTGEITYLGSWTAPNLTPDVETGIGAVSDGELARMFRTGVNRDGRIALPFKDAYADIAEEDLVAIISYLRSLPPARGVAPRKEVNVLGRITLAYFIEPYAPATPPPDRFPPEVTARYGDYLANTVGRCESCHTPRNLNTGEFLGPPFSGGFPFQSRNDPGVTYVSPNLTPDSATGHITRWSEDDFVRRIQAGARIPDSPMPWGSYMRMTEDDLRAVYRYLHGLEPVYRDNGPTVQREGEV